MPWVWLSLGSNVDREANLRGAVAALDEAFGPLRLSAVYQSPAEGFAGEPFYNLVAGMNVDIDPATLRQRLRAIEDAHGRLRGGEKFSSRTLDIDILTYDDLLDEQQDIPRDEILHYAFVLGPLAEVAADQLHPRLQRSYGELWQAFDPALRDGLEPVDLSF